MRDADRGARAPRTPRGAWLAAVLAAAALAAPASAPAFYGNGAQIVSADFGRLEQADDTTVFAALSADGRYVAFQTRARNFFADDDPDPPERYRAGGVFRFDLDTRRLELVADGDLRDEATNVLLVRGAQNPSISGDGRYVAFATAQRLVAADVNDNLDVYVRDMTVPIRSAGAFELISAKDGGDVPATYAPPSTPVVGGDPGADVARGAAISLDGNRVAFRTTEPASDLPDHATTDTPGHQVFVRDRAASTTTLVTRVSATGAPAGGAIGPAAISGDGTTVVWNGQNAPLQTPFMPGENTDLPGFSYYLWRRVADGPTAPTRRITGMADLDDPACQPTGPIPFDEFLTGPCYGPLASPEIGLSGNVNQLPALSADGRRVAFLTTARPRASASTGLGLDLYVTDMSPGVTRKAGTVELTREGAAGTAESAPIETASISSDGTRVAIVTARTRFALPALTQLGTPRAIADAQDVYVVDLPARTIERATRAHDGGDTDSAVVNETSLSSDGGRVAFVSFAGNLFFGDANQRADAFVATRQSEPPPQPPEAPPGAGGPDATVEVDRDRAAPRIRASARARRDGTVAVTVTVPAAGGVKAVASARAGKPRKLRTLATASTRARRAGRIRVVLRPVRRYRAELRRRKRLATRVRVDFVASRGGRRLRTTLRTTLHWAPNSKQRARK